MSNSSRIQEYSGRKWINYFKILVFNLMCDSKWKGCMKTARQIISIKQSTSGSSDLTIWKHQTGVTIHNWHESYA